MEMVNGYTEIFWDTISLWYRHCSYSEDMQFETPPFSPELEKM